MKKILLGMALVCMAVSVQAAAVGWGTSPLYVPDSITGAYTTLAGNGVAFTATVAFFTSSDGGDTFTPFAESSSNLSKTGTNKSGVVSATTDSLFTPSTTYYASIYVTDPTGNWYLQQEYVSFFVPAAGSGAVTFDFGTTGSWVQVPEPATMALLGIGVVAVGLRRRRK